MVGDCLCLPVDMDVWYGGIVAWDMPSSLLQVKTVAGTDKLAQASWSRLGEINRGSPKPSSHEWSPRRPTVSFERTSISPRREGSRLSEIPRVFLLPFSSPRLGEGGARLSEHVSPERGPSAWARCWARQCCVGIFVISGWSVLVGYECYDEGHVYNEAWCIRSMIHEIQMMGLVWVLACELNEIGVINVA